VQYGRGLTLILEATKTIPPSLRLIPFPCLSIKS